MALDGTELALMTAGFFLEKKLCVKIQDSHWLNL